MAGITRYILLNRGGDSLHFPTYSDREKIEYFNRWRSWIDNLVVKGKFETAEPLESSGFLLKGTEMAAEQSEMTPQSVSGYCIINAENWEEAVKIAQTCPVLSEGGTCEIREIKIKP